MANLIEVDEEEYGRRARVYDTLAKIAKNPQAAKLLEQAHKVADPAVPTPILDAEIRQLEPLQALRKEFDEYKTKAEKDREAAELAARQDSFQAQWIAGQNRLKQRGYTDEAIKKFEEQMTTAGVTDHELFADAWERRNPPAAPASPSSVGGAWNFAEVPEGEAAGDKFVKDLIATQGKQDYVADRAASQALNEFRQRAGGRR